MKGDRLYLVNISECIAQIETYTHEGREAFLQARMAQDAVVRNLEVIGEATKRLSAELRDKHRSLPWRQIAGLRDVLIHDYGSVDIEEVWAIVQKDLPGLKQQVDEILKGMEEGNPD